MKPSELIPDLIIKADKEYLSGAKTYLLDYYISELDYICFKKYCKKQRKTTKNIIKLPYKYGGICLKHTNNKELYNKLVNSELKHE